MSLNIVLMGLPGAGKGTQSPNIEAHFHIPHVSTGDIYRKNIQHHTKLGRIAEQYIDKGKLCPDKLTNALMKSELEKSSLQHGYILDGYPRTIDQCRALDRITRQLQNPVNIALYIKVDRPLLIKRLSARFVCKNCGATYNKIYLPTKRPGVCDKCGGHEFFQRSDDRPQAVKQRLHDGIPAMKKLVRYYKEKGILRVINGHPDFDQTQNKIDVGKEIINTLK